MGYRMNGFSGFGNSPAKQVPKKKQKGPVEKANRDRKLEEQIGNIGDEINFLNQDYRNHGKISKAQYDAKMKILRTKEKVSVNENRRKQGLGPEKESPNKIFTPQKGIAMVIGANKRKTIKYKL